MAGSSPAMTGWGGPCRTSMFRAAGIRRHPEIGESHDAVLVPHHPRESGDPCRMGPRFRGDDGSSASPATTGSLISGRRLKGRLSPSLPLPPPPTPWLAQRHQPRLDLAALAFLAAEMDQ